MLPSMAPPSAAGGGPSGGSSSGGSGKPLLVLSTTGEQEALRKLMAKPIVKVQDIGPEMLAEAVELITMAVDKHLTSRNIEAAAAMVKNSFDRKFGAHWHCVIGEGFGFEITYEQRHLIFLFYGSLGVLCYKV